MLAWASVLTPEPEPSSPANEIGSLGLKRRGHGARVPVAALSGDCFP